jgi:hypothetical protein
MIARFILWLAQQLRFFGTNDCLFVRDHTMLIELLPKEEAIYLFIDAQAERLLDALESSGLEESRFANKTSTRKD